MLNTFIYFSSKQSCEVTPQLEETPEKLPSFLGEGLLFLPYPERNPKSSVQTEEEA